MSRALRVVVLAASVAAGFWLLSLAAGSAAYADTGIAALAGEASSSAGNTVRAALHDTPGDWLRRSESVATGHLDSATGKAAGRPHVDLPVASNAVKRPAQPSAPLAVPSRTSSPSLLQPRERHRPVEREMAGTAPISAPGTPFAPRPQPVPPVLCVASGTGYPGSDTNAWLPSPSSSALRSATGGPVGTDDLFIMHTATKPSVSPD